MCISNEEIVDDVEHAIFRCNRWYPMKNQLGYSIAVKEYVKTVMFYKKEEEREQDKGNPQYYRYCIHLINLC